MIVEAAILVGIAAAFALGERRHRRLDARDRRLAQAGRLALPAPEEPNAERIAAWRAQSNGRPDPTGYRDAGVYWQWSKEFAGWFADDGRFSPAHPDPPRVVQRPAWARAVPMPRPLVDRKD